MLHVVSKLIQAKLYWNGQRRLRNYFLAVAKFEVWRHTSLNSAPPTAGYIQTAGIYVRVDSGRCAWFIVGCRLHERFQWLMGSVDRMIDSGRWLQLTGWNCDVIFAADSVLTRSVGDLGWGRVTSCWDCWNDCVGLVSRRLSFILAVIVIVRLCDE